ncbi:UDP-N-acetylmuramate dehydrogenase [Tundrisphaera sp. TA3]|uniref:UDP-N-acetylmuramate dehydrogenase n=1 Tax=Tundrisphaera sp. TA3 TaxID=3435775 RepID=UPI003EBC6AEB
MHSFEEFREIVTTDEPLAPHTWFRLGGSAAFLARPRDASEVAALLRRARESDIPVRILAGGSNVLVRDEGFPGLVIHLESPAFSDVAIDGGRVTAGAAVPLTALISQTTRAGLAGLEVLTGIPGTVGGAVKGNSGGRQGAIGTHVRSVTVVDEAGELVVRDADELRFDYRSSDLDDPVIVSVDFQLEREDPETVVKRMRRIWIIKKENQPYGHQWSGCIFKNPSPELSAGTLIERAGMKGQRVGAAEISDRHANYIVAHPGATSDEVLRLIDLVRQKVKQQFGHDLALQIKIW